MESTSITVTLEEMMPIIQEALSVGETVKFAPRGISMLPMLRQGIDSVILSPLPQKLKKYDLPLYQRANGKFILHRIVKAGETYTCVGDNQHILEHGVTHDQMIALVTSFTRGDKEYSVNDPRYRLYCILWHRIRPCYCFCRRAYRWLRRRIHR